MCFRHLCQEEKSVPHKTIKNEKSVIITQVYLKPGQPWNKQCLVWQRALTSEVCVVLQSLRCADPALCCLKGHSPIVVILSHCPFVDGTAGIGIMLSVVVSMLAAGHPSAIPGLARVCHMMPYSILAFTQ